MAIKMGSVAVGAILGVVGVVGFLQVSASVMNATEVNGPIMSSAFGVYFLAALALLSYGALAGRQPRLP